MNITVRLFARAKDVAGHEEVELTLPDSARIRDVRRALAERHPALASILPQLFIAVDERFSRDDDPVPPGARLACFPPVSGG